MKFRIASLLILIVASSWVVHEYHISLLQIMYGGNGTSLELSLKLEVEDMEKALESKAGRSLNLGDANEAPGAEALVYAYVRENLSLRANDKVLAYEFVGKELSKDLHDLWVYMEVDSVPVFDSLRTFTVKNAVLTELYEDQSNMVKFAPDKSHQKSLQLNPNLLEGTITFK